MTPEFIMHLSEFMKKRGISQKTEAIRVAVREACEKLTKSNVGFDFRTWLGAGLKVSPNPKLKFRSENDLWK